MRESLTHNGPQAPNRPHPGLALGCGIRAVGAQRIARTSSGWYREPVQRLGYLVILIALTSCRTDGGTAQPGTHPTDPEASGASQAEVTAVRANDCVPLEAVAVADGAYARGASKLAEAFDGEHYLTEPFEQAMAALRVAAEQGHRAAQSSYGRTLFSTLFTNQAPVPEEEDDYVAAFMFMRIAALRGDPDVQGYLPGLTAPTPPLQEPPLDQVPAAWITASYARADAWMVCHGGTVGDRGAAARP
jgi:hypothetical protein